MGETSQKMSENTGETINKYPASSCQSYTAAEKNNTRKNREADLGAKQAKIRLLKAE